MASIISAGTTSGTALNMAGDTSGVLQLATNGSTTAVTVDTSQNVGIGTTSPSALLHTYTSTQESVRFARNSTASSAYVTFYANNASSTQVQYAGILGDVASSTAGSHGGNLLFYTTGSGTSAERMRIDSNGNVLVGTTGLVANGKLTVNGQSRFYESTSDATAASRFDKSSATTTTSQVFIQFTVNNQSSGSGQINANGSSQAAFGSFSDERLKENIVDLPSQLSKVLTLRPVEFDYKTGGHQTGFIAQEMQKVFPDAVGEDGSEEKYLTVTGWNKTEAILVKAIQEQQTIINDLKARITALEGAA